MSIKGGWKYGERERKESDGRKRGLISSYSINRPRARRICERPVRFLIAKASGTAPSPSHDADNFLISQNTPRRDNKGRGPAAKGHKCLYSWSASAETLKQTGYGGRTKVGGVETAKGEQKGRDEWKAKRRDNTHTHRDKGGGEAKKKTRRGRKDTTHLQRLRIY
ncbi:hypothetical protein B0H13DRAFT_1888183, partial [Mycena leptocephala]